VSLATPSDIDPKVCATDNFAGGQVFKRGTPTCRYFASRHDMSRCIPILAGAALLACTVAAAPAGAEIGVSPAREFVPHQVVLEFKGERSGKAMTLPPGVDVHRAAAALRRSPRIAYAAPNYIATASAQSPPLPDSGIPNDPGTISYPPGPPGGWVSLQWNFLPWEGTGTALLPVSPGGIDAVGAWQHLIAAKRRGARGIVVAVLDTGIAYRNEGARFRRSPDFSSGQFVKGYDFVNHDRLPLDQNGHGTHVAGTIAEKTNNGIGLVGLAYRAKLMPVRVLDRHGSGQADDIARGIHFAVAHGADVINMSFNFGCGKNVPGVDEELRNAYRKGVVTVASIGNLGSESCVSPPATGPHTIGVGGTTEGGCLGGYSLLPGKGVDILAPGGGLPISGCPSVSNRSIYQVTLKGGNTRRFGEPGAYVGTSMAAAHVSGVAAMVLASGVLEQDVSPSGKVNRLIRQLRSTARGLGLPPARQGAGLIDAGKATE
jgi:serine protease